ncbi:MAG: peptidoglycan recognition family protein [bacterium]
MEFKEKYNIIPRYITPNTKRRSGTLISPSVKFIVAHDTGNTNSTADNNVSYYQRSANEIYASAHIFVDDKEIIECVPVLTGRSEKAWHVRYSVSGDNDMFGYNANDTAIGIEYCYGSNINSDESYKRYIWTIAYICFKFGLDPKKSIVGHHVLDPGRRSDPVNGLSKSNRTYENLLKDVVNEYSLCLINQGENNMMRLIRNSSSKKVYAISNDNKKHWIFNGETFRIGVEMGLWGDYNTIELIDDDQYAEGHLIVLLNQE